MTNAPSDSCWGIIVAGSVWSNATFMTNAPSDSCWGIIAASSVWSNATYSLLI